MVTHETLIREVPGSNPVAGQLGWGFSGFLNLKIAKELVIFKDKCRVGLHIPLLKRQSLILQPFRRFTYVIAHSPTFRRFTYVTAHSATLPLLYLRHSSFSLASRP